VRVARLIKASLEDFNEGTKPIHVEAHDCMQPAEGAATPFSQAWWLLACSAIACALSIALIRACRVATADGLSMGDTTAKNKMESINSSL
jgi:hypothetical protein